MNLFCVADTHGGYLDMGGAEECDRIFLLGDMGGSYAWQVSDFLYAHPRFRDRIFSVLGNHDDDSDVLNYPWLNFQDYGQTQTISGRQRQYTVLFLPFQESYREIPLRTVSDIIVSHQPPVRYPGMEGFHGGVPYFKRIGEKTPSSLWIHGHIHVNQTSEDGMTLSVYGKKVISI